MKRPRDLITRAIEPAIVVVVALGVRLAYLHGVRGTPVAELLLIDSETYDRFARLILEGRFRGEEVYSMNILYPYALAGLYALFEGSVRAVLVAQSVLDSASCVLAWWIGRACFGAATGLIAGLLTAVYGPMVFYSGSLLTPTLITFLGLVVIALLVRYGERPAWPVAAAAGLVLGLAILARGNNLLFAFLGLAWFRVRAASPGQALRHGLAFAGAAIAVGAIVTLRNYAAEGQFVPIAANYAAFYIGHNPEATGLYSMPGFIESAGFQSEVMGTRDAVAKMLGRPVTLAESSQYLFAEGWRFALGNPIAEIRLLLTKLYYFWNQTESPTNLNYYFARDFSPLLRALPVTFGVVAPLGLLGMWFARAQWRRHLVLHLYVLVGLATALLFFVSAEYRLPVAPVLVMFAAYAVVRLGASVRSTADPRAARAARGGAVGRGERSRKAGPSRAAARGGRSAASSRPWLQVLMLLPALLLACNFRTPRLANQSLKRVDYLNAGTLYRMRGDRDRAKRMFEQARAIDPRYRPALEALAALALEAGDVEEGLRMAREAKRARPAGLGAAPGSVSNAIQDSLLDVARVFQEGRYREALAGFRRLRARAEVTGDSAATVSLMNNIGLCHYRLREWAAAEETFLGILDRDPGYVKAHTNLAKVLAAQGRLEEAVRCYERALILAPGDPRVEADLARLRARTP